mmetsp:Transcript_1768/g.4828  ORF Transcript_1768/g.4828 Transcript_1768/m.4828 type:complete len:277 (-) Transcript_1768:104-934(-)
MAAVFGRRGSSCCSMHSVVRIVVHAFFFSCLFQFGSIPLRRTRLQRGRLVPGVHLGPMVSCGGSPPFELGPTSIHVGIPLWCWIGRRRRRWNNIFTLVVVVVVVDHRCCCCGCPIGRQHLVRLGNVNHGRYGQTSQFGQDGTQCQGGACTTPLTLRIAHNGARFEGKCRRSKMIQRIQETRTGSVIVFGRNGHVGIGLLQEALHVRQRGRHLAARIGKFGLFQQRQAVIILQRIQHGRDNVTAAFQSVLDQGGDAGSDNGTGRTVGAGRARENHDI